MTVVLASRGYPESSSSGDVITGLDEVEDAEVFHAGTARADGELVTAGGRVLGVTALGRDAGRGTRSRVRRASSGSTSTDARCAATSRRGRSTG